MGLLYIIDCFYKLAKNINFPKNELSAIKKQLKERGYAYTTRISDEQGKYDKPEPGHISNPDLFDAVTIIEGEHWAETDRKGGPNSLTDLIKAYQSYLDIKDEYGLDKFDAEIASLFDHSGVVYGEGGVSRWVIRGECLVLDGNSTHEGKKEKAKAEGFSVIE